MNAPSAGLIVGLIGIRFPQIMGAGYTYIDQAMHEQFTWQVLLILVYSPGVALVFEATALSLEHGLSCDYMAGEYPYKLRFANARRMLHRVEASAAQLDAVAQGIAKRKIA